MSADQVRRFTERQAAEILRRAAKIDPGANEPEGLTLQDISRIGSELGVAPEALQLAVEELDHEQKSYQTRWLGAPPSYELERFIDQPLDQETWQGIVSELQRTYGSSIPAPPDGTTQWEWKHSGGYVRATASPEGNTTRVHLMCFIDHGLTWVFFGALLILLAIVASFVSLQVPAPILVFGVLSITLLTWALLRSLVSQWFTQDRQRSQALMARLTHRSHRIHATQAATAVVDTSNGAELPTTG